MTPIDEKAVIARAAAWVASLARTPTGFEYSGFISHQWYPIVASTVDGETLAACEHGSCMLEIMTNTTPEGGELLAIFDTRECADKWLASLPEHVRRIA